MKYFSIIALSLLLSAASGCDAPAAAPAPTATIPASASGTSAECGDRDTSFAAESAAMWGEGALACGRPCNPTQPGNCGPNGCCKLSGSCGYMCASDCGATESVDDGALACGRPCNPNDPGACGGGGGCCLTPSCGYICGGSCGGGDPF